MRLPNTKPASKQYFLIILLKYEVNNSFWSKLTLDKRSVTFIIALGSRRWATVCAIRNSSKITISIATMSNKVKVEPECRLIQQKSRAAVLTKTAQGALPATNCFGRTCDGLKGCGIVFNSANPCADCFTHVKREIDEHIGKEYTNVGEVWWNLNRESLKTINLPASLATNATGVEKGIFKVDDLEYVK